jgi:hypothetical protein
MSSAAGPCITHDDPWHPKCQNHECCIGHNITTCKALVTTQTYGTIQIICPGGTKANFGASHDGITDCPGGEWRDFMSLGWFYDRPQEALGIFREDPLTDKDTVRLVLHTETEEVYVEQPRSNNRPG